MAGEYPHTPEGWSIKPLIDCTEDKIISYGIVQPGRHVEEGIPIIRVNNFTDNGLDLSSVLRVAPSVEEKYARTRLNGGEVLLTLVGSTGQSTIAPQALKGWNVPRAIAVIRPAEDIGATWINICLHSQAIKNFLDARANTTVQKTLNLKDVRQIPVLIPPEKTKQFIESVISTLNDKIELNRQMNATLEAMAQALFKSWFVDFDPVIDNALAAGNPIPEPLQTRAAARKALDNKRKPLPIANGCLSATLPEGIQNQFPNRFVFNEDMGWVPEGWEVGPITRLCDKIQNGGTPKRNKPEYWDNATIPWLTSGEVRQTIINNTENSISDLGLGNSSAKWLPIGSTVVAMYGATAGQVAYLANSMTTNQAVCGLIPKTSFQYFNYLALARLVGELANQARGSAQQNISKKIIEETHTVQPSVEVADLFSSQVSVYFEKWISTIRSNGTLANIRDTLLPKLLSGQLSIHEAEKQVAEVL